MTATTLSEIRSDHVGARLCHNPLRYLKIGRTLPRWTVDRMLEISSRHPNFSSSSSRIRATYTCGIVFKPLTTDSKAPSTLLCSFVFVIRSQHLPRFLPSTPGDPTFASATSASSGSAIPPSACLIRHLHNCRNSQPNFLKEKRPRRTSQTSPQRESIPLASNEPFSLNRKHRGMGG